MTAETATLSSDSGALPHLQCVERVWKLPVVERAWSQSSGLYGRVKGCNGVVSWTLSAAEASFLRALQQASPLARRLEQPISSVDQTLCKGLDLVEERLPIVKEQPEQIYKTAKTFVSSALQPARNTVSVVKEYGTTKALSLKELSLAKANEVLASRYGSMALSGFDNTAAVAEKYIDYYLPPVEGEPMETDVPADKGDKVLTSVHTVGRLSMKAARRLYHALSSQVRTLNRENIQEYVRSLAELVHITNYVNALRRTPAIASAPVPAPASAPAPAPTPNSAAPAPAPNSTPAPTSAPNPTPAPSKKHPSGKASPNPADKKEK
ncbi:lipid storage droplets surface-binding protein 2-like isoform X2 [Bacillus rossius redtenbacheri]